MSEQLENKIMCRAMYLFLARDGLRSTSIHTLVDGERIFKLINFRFLYHFVFI